MTPDEILGAPHPVFPWFFATFVAVRKDGTCDVQYETPEVALHSPEEIMRWVRRRHQGKW